MSSSNNVPKIGYLYERWLKVEKIGYIREVTKYGCESKNKN